MNIRDAIWHRLLRRPYKLAVTTQGDGEVLVVLHGLGETHKVWQPLIKRLQPGRWQVVGIDLLGFGDSPRPTWGNYAVQDHARAVMATLRSLGVRGKFTVVGHSMGCLVAAHIASKYPARVKHMVLYAPPLFADEPVFTKHARKRERYFAFFEYVAAHPQLIFLQRRWLWRLAKRMSGIDLNEEKWVPFERSLRNTIMQQRAYDELIALHVPTDIVHGRLDFIVIRTEVDKMLKANPFVAMHSVTGTHGISPPIARYLAKLLKAK